jgi:predicted ArsR family transcriptional regulator
MYEDLQFGSSGVAAARSSLDWRPRRHFTTLGSVENNPAPDDLLGPGLGPRPSRAGAGRPRLSTSRAALLEKLVGQPEPTSLAALIAATGLHPNTLREHLAALVRHGLVRRHRAEPSGRGRPAWLYTAEDDAGSGRSEYAGLAATLAAVILRTSDSPHEDAIIAGMEWGGKLARSRGKPKQRKVSVARRQVVELLDEIGFAPAYDERRSVVRLTRCPLLEAARRYPDVVCGVHLGIVRGALQEYGADLSRTHLLPFSEPGACRLDLRDTLEPR